MSITNIIGSCGNITQIDGETWIDGKKAPEARPGYAMYYENGEWVEKKAIKKMYTNRIGDKEEQTIEYVDGTIETTFKDCKSSKGSSMNSMSVGSSNTSIVCSNVSVGGSVSFNGLTMTIGEGHPNVTEDGGKNEGDAEKVTGSNNVITGNTHGKVSGNGNTIYGDTHGTVSGNRNVIKGNAQGTVSGNDNTIHGNSYGKISGSGNTIHGNSYGKVASGNTVLGTRF